MGRYLAEHGVSYLYTFGPAAEEVAQSAIRHGLRADKVFVNVHLDAPEQTVLALQKDLRPGDLLLVKASRAVRAERILQLLREKMEPQT